ncbi:hypothetical protein HOY82DRAFT_606102 [Tuber indicum]|nr:hypothetical protein HOY82DRAFT_606102 [Tuber indicum]
MYNFTKVTIKSSQGQARRYKDERVDNLTKEGRQWIYTDGAKRGGALAWCGMEEDRLEKSTTKESVPNVFDISKREHAALSFSLEDAVSKKENKIVIFTDSQSTVRRNVVMDDGGEKEDIKEYIAMRLQMDWQEEVRKEE